VSGLIEKELSILVAREQMFQGVRATAIFSSSAFPARHAYLRMRILSHGGAKALAVNPLS
jgi:hypothetical protein